MAAAEYELVGVGVHQVGDSDGWCVTYEKSDGNFHHHMFPATIFRTYAEQCGLDVDDPDDFNEILEIVLYDPFGGDEHPNDHIDLPQAQGLMAAGKRDKKTKTGRKMRRRADRAKQDFTITGMGIDGIRQRLWTERHKGADALDERLTRLERARARTRAVTSGSGSDGGDRTAQGADR